MNEIERLRIMVQGLLALEAPTQTRIREVITETRRACPTVSDAEAEDLALEFEAIHGVRMTDGAALQDPAFEPWLDTARSGIDFYYWSRYRRFMAEKGLSGQVLGGLSNVTDRILGLLENPEKPGRWDRRGMVMGHVQSGKTANYIGVVTKAADAGYRVIIIIAGLQNKLRNQTQRRVDEGFVGFSSTGRDKASVPQANHPRRGPPRLTFPAERLHDCPPRLPQGNSRESQRPPAESQPACRVRDQEKPEHAPELDRLAEDPQCSGSAPTRSPSHCCSSTTRQTMRR